jgi:cytochrome c-type biogenesis protein CcmH
VSRTVRGVGDNAAVLGMFRRQLADIDTDLAQGRLSPDEASAARAELTRRLLAETDREEKESNLAGTNPTELSWRIGAALGVAALPTAAPVTAVGAPAAINSPAAVSASDSGPADSVELGAAADQLKARLERDPDHVEGWAFLAGPDPIAAIASA